MRRRHDRRRRSRSAAPEIAPPAAPAAAVVKNVAKPVAGNGGRTRRRPTRSATARTSKNSTREPKAQRRRRERAPRERRRSSRPRGSNAISRRNCADDQHLRYVGVQGEVSNLRAQANGKIVLHLKDREAVLELRGVLPSGRGNVSGVRQRRRVDRLRRSEDLRANSTYHSIATKVELAGVGALHAKIRRAQTQTLIARGSSPTRAKAVAALIRFRSRSSVRRPVTARATFSPRRASARRTSRCGLFARR